MVEEETVRRVARNAKIELSKEELEKFTKELNDILEAFKKIEKAKTENIKPSFHPLEIKDRTRKDEAKEGLKQKEALKNAENKEDGYFKGPSIV